VATQAPELTLTLDRLAGEVRMELGAFERRIPELDHLLMANGGLPTSSGYVLPVLGFRRASIDIAAVLRERRFRVTYDDAVEELLRAQLAEVRARRSAAALEPEEADRVRERVIASDRFTRDLTTEQLRDLGYLLVLPHGANFSVPGAGKTTSLLAIYEALREEGRVDRLLVVAPKNAFLSWEEEIEECYGAEEDRPRAIRL
jgi:hypothetical protein